MTDYQENNPANLKNLMKIMVQTKAPLNPPEGGKLPSFGGVGGGAIKQDKKNRNKIKIT